MSIHRGLLISAIIGGPITGSLGYLFVHYVHKHQYLRACACLTGIVLFWTVAPAFVVLSFSHLPKPF